jgi:hypothetical protein
MKLEKPSSSKRRNYEVLPPKSLPSKLDKLVKEAIERAEVDLLLKQVSKDN